MTIVDKDGNELSSTAAANPSGTLIRQPLEAVIKALSGPLTTLCENIAHPRLAQLGLGEYTARCWAHKRASSKDPEPVLIVHCRVTAGADVNSKRVDVTEQHHATFALRELGKDGGGEMLATIACELIGIVVARTIMRLVDAGAIEAPPAAEAERAAAELPPVLHQVTVTGAVGTEPAP